MSVYDMVDACPKEMLSDILLLSDSFLLNVHNFPELLLMAEVYSKLTLPYA